MKKDDSAGPKASGKSIPIDPATKAKVRSEEKDLATALQKIADLESKLQKCHEKELRLFADVQNLRRRAEEERSTLIFESGKKILSEILPVIDNFERALQNLPPELRTNEWVQGILAIQKQLHDLLKKEGVAEINEIGVDLDPNLHEAMMADPEGEKGKVTKILEKGFRYMGRVLRHAKVAVGDKS